MARKVIFGGLSMGILKSLWVEDSCIPATKTMWFGILSISVSHSISHPSDSIFIWA